MNEVTTQREGGANGPKGTVPTLMAPVMDGVVMEEALAGWPADSRELVIARARALVTDLRRRADELEASLQELMPLTKRP